MDLFKVYKLHFTTVPSPGQKCRKNRDLSEVHLGTADQCQSPNGCVEVPFVPTVPSPTLIWTTDPCYANCRSIQHMLGYLSEGPQHAQTPPYSHLDRYSGHSPCCPKYRMPGYLSEGPQHTLNPNHTPHLDHGESR